MSAMYCSAIQMKQLDPRTEAFIIYFTRGFKRKRAKIRRILQDLKYDEETKVFTAPSSRFPDKFYQIIYSNAKKEWVCDCEAICWRRYMIYESVDQRHRQREALQCIHILAARIWLAMSQVQDLCK